MADCDVIDQDLFDQQPDDPLPIGDFQRFCWFAQSLEECGQDISANRKKDIRLAA
ncbi:hypothetical protein [Mesorhizobium sp.]|uniref:hypothetical protein n=1 Tax=Mesorhizobium sp. TaxID=1871066 RepID=UPI0025BBE8A9|nr:hypothetical protein [Mesorhizobium sp.]